MRLLAIGMRADPVFVYFLARARMLGHHIVAVDLKDVADSGYWLLHVPAREGDFIQTSEGRVFPLEFKSAFVRLIDPLPDLVGNYARWSGMLAAVRCWLQDWGGKVINPPVVHHHNGSKTWHEAWLAAQGFAVPPSLTTSSIDMAREFVRAGDTVLKPCSGVRANSRRLTEAELERYNASRGPLHLQRVVPGDDIRAHVVGKTVIAVGIHSEVLDYRTDPEANLYPITLSDGMADRMVTATVKQGLVFAGWDFKVEREGHYWCLEVNPMPAFALYDRALNGSICEALLRELDA
jgi:hypothetical protein